MTKRFSPLRWLVTALLLMAGSSCEVVKSDGMYVGTQCTGWDNSHPSGTGPSQQYVSLNDTRKLISEVYFTTLGKGTLRINVYCGGSQPQFVSPKIEVVYNDHHTHEEIDAKSEVVLFVGESEDFTITIPSYQIGAFKESSLTARFRWNGTPVYKIEGPQ